MEDPRYAVRAAAAEAPIGPRERVLVLLSGGPDSTCLTHLLVDLLGPARLGALHVNYRLRDGADGDEEFCRTLCDELGVTLWVERPVLGAGNVQAEARAARYRLADRIASDRGFDAIATGHTASDQVETLLYRLASSPGRRALLGIAAREGRIVRPLLHVTREQVLAYCDAGGLSYREDPTNADPRFARNRIRRAVVPELRKVHPSAAQNILATRDQLADESAALDLLVEQAMRDVGAGGETHAVEVGRLTQLERPLQRLVLRELAERAAGKPVALGGAHADDIVALASRGGSRSLDLGGVRARTEYGVIRFARGEPEQLPPEPVALGVPGRCRFGDWEIESEILPGGAAPAAAPDAASLDAGKLGESLIVRSWRDGDRMRPLGLGGTKALQDIFTDRKVPRALRRQLPIVEAAGEIAWVAGVAVSDDFKVRRESHRVVYLRARARTRRRE